MKSYEVAYDKTTMFRSSCSCSNVSDVPDAGLVSDNLCIDRNLTCANGDCDPQTGKCVCPRKMRAIRQDGGRTRCVYSK